MAKPSRRSARLSKQKLQKPQDQEHFSTESTQYVSKLASVLERDDTPDVAEQSSIDKIVATPTSVATINSQMARLSGLKTPKTQPSVDRAEMHPELVHQSTAKAPDEGLRFGFVDRPSSATVALARGTPSKSAPASLPQKLTALDFNFGAESQLSNEAQRLMDTVREEAARVKAQMKAEQEAQQRKDEEAEQAVNGISAAGRKIAKPKGKSGRFSDIHMAQFKKMDSIANHPSAFRARTGPTPSFARPTAQSLKRTGSRAELDDSDRPRTAGKGTPGRPPPPFLGRPASTSPFKSIPQKPQHSAATPAKRARRSELHDVSASKSVGEQQPAGAPVLHESFSRTSLFSPTKASMTRVNSHIPRASPNKSSTLRRMGSIQSLREAADKQPSMPVSVDNNNTSQTAAHGSPTKKSILNRPLPPLPTTLSSDNVVNPLHHSKSASQLANAVKGQGLASKLPTWSGLKSILRGGRKPGNALVDNRQGTPKRPNTAAGSTGSTKKVDFTPSVKSRHAVKLAATSPSPAKQSQKPLTPYALFDSAAYLLHDDDTEDDEDAWEETRDAGAQDVVYPTLPPISTPPRVSTDSFEDKSKALSRRESREFKSIFTTLHPKPQQPSTLTSVNTALNATNPVTNAYKVLRSPSNRSSQNSPSTIRRVRTSNISEPVQPFQDAAVATVPHGLIAKKRRRESAIDDDRAMGDDDAKENRRISVMPKVPGGWNDSDGGEADDEGDHRAGKRARIAPPSPKGLKQHNETGLETKKASKAREEAKKSAGARKGRGILSLTRLNMLSRPKQRN